MDTEEHGRVDEEPKEEAKVESFDERVTRLSNEKFDNPEWQPKVSGVNRRALAVAEAKREAK